jgi:RNA polymerase sigma-70 factor (ECF subfamily)
MEDREWLAERFEANRPHLRAVAYRMLGSLSEADDAIQECWLRLDRAGAADLNNLRAWLTTVIGRVCLDMLRARRSRLEDAWVVEPVVTNAEDPEAQAELADSVGLALLVVLETLTPDERLAFVLHDMFGVPFEEIASMTDRTSEAARQLASRARRRVQTAAPQPDADVRAQRRVVEAFLAASRAGDFDALVEVLHPDVVFRRHARTPQPITFGAAATARALLARGTPLAPYARVVLVNGGAGAMVVVNDRVVAVVGFTVVEGRVAAIDLVTDGQTLAEIDIVS